MITTISSSSVISASESLWADVAGKGIAELSHSLLRADRGKYPPLALRECRPQSALLLRNGSAESEIEELSQGGMIIGMFAQSSYTEAETQLHSGDVLALQWRCHRSPQPQRTRIRRCTAEKSAPPRRAPAYRRNGRLRSRGAQDLDVRPQHDDLTFVLMKVGPSAHERAFKHACYIIATGGAGSSGLPALFSGVRIIIHASIAITTSPIK